VARPLRRGLHRAREGGSALAAAGARREPQGLPRDLDGRPHRIEGRLRGGRLPRRPEGKKEECVVYVFHPLDAAGEKWEKKVLDDKGMGSEDVICATSTATARSTSSRSGRSTKNVKIYWNEGK
jgi:hypothetical protein